ncbi:hypothetical protein C8N35_107190 [Breoghania corrubedonensis]|uniref:UPF0276 protein C8N35_107190 n=1 Tax=Breoghania corrubedonensis TaxID=665038 RepID=A0A2T5V6X3_9HYPH|nr:DUF692 domain-containing protein [Breoghania corrubedonensis]PTW59476.1 hypothetical protein C8N35_107190 [Breoghania corrubedonensis]
MPDKVHRTEVSHPFSCAPMPRRAGAGLKAAHVADILSQMPDIGFFEVHAENYMGAGGPPHAQLHAIRERYALSLHGVGLSIGGEAPLDRAHLARLKALDERYRPALFSEHLAWSSHEGTYFNDLLPVAYDQPTLDRVVAHIDEVQEVLGRQMFLENPSTYVSLARSTMDELDFLTEVSARSGCGLLLDINNVYISAINHGWSARDYLDRFPLERAGEIHLAGHVCDDDGKGNGTGQTLLIDAHDRAVADVVWVLYAQVIERAGPLPTLIEWDNEVPEWPVLLAEAEKADAILARHAEVCRAVAG